MLELNEYDMHRISTHADIDRQYEVDHWYVDERIERVSKRMFGIIGCYLIGLTIIGFVYNFSDATLWSPLSLFLAPVFGIATVAATLILGWVMMGAFILIVNSYYWVLGLDERYLTL